jgi:hypothetical protein
MLIETHAATRLVWSRHPDRAREPFEVEIRSATMPRTAMCPLRPVVWFSWRRITAFPSRAGQVSLREP